MMLLLLVMLITLIGVPVLASHGMGRRAHYVALAIVTPFLAFFVFSMPQGPPPNATEAQRLGAEILDSFIPNLGLWLFAMALASVLGAVLYRSSQKRAA